MHDGFIHPLSADFPTGSSRQRWRVRQDSGSVGPRYDSVWFGPRVGFSCRMVPMEGKQIASDPTIATEVTAEHEVRGLRPSR